MSLGFLSKAIQPLLRKKPRTISFVFFPSSPVLRVPHAKVAPVIVIVARPRGLSNESSQMVESTHSFHGWSAGK